MRGRQKLCTVCFCFKCGKWGIYFSTVSVPQQQVEFNGIALGKGFVLTMAKGFNLIIPKFFFLLGLKF